MRRSRCTRSAVLAPGTRWLTKVGEVTWRPRVDRENDQLGQGTPVGRNFDPDRSGHEAHRLDQAELPGSDHSDRARTSRTRYLQGRTATVDHQNPAEVAARYDVPLGCWFQPRVRKMATRTGSGEHRADVLARAKRLERGDGAGGI